jgi:Tfp pilus assembly protein PilX
METRFPLPTSHFPFCSSLTAAHSVPASILSPGAQVRAAERGIALLEVLAAIVILTIAGLSLVSLVAQATASTVTARDRETEQADEERLLAAETLLTRADLDLRLGERSVGPYVVTVARPERMLYRVAVSRATAPDVEDLVTVVFREAPTP